MRNGCRGRIADMTVPEALRVDTDGGIKPDMAFLALLADVLAAILLCLHSSSRCLFAPFATTAMGAFFLYFFIMCLLIISVSSDFLNGLLILAEKPNSLGLDIMGSSA